MVIGSGGFIVLDVGCFLGVMDGWLDRLFEFNLLLYNIVQCVRSLFCLGRMWWCFGGVMVVLGRVVAVGLMGWDGGFNLVRGENRPVWTDYGVCNRVMGICVCTVLCTYVCMCTRLYVLWARMECLKGVHTLYRHIFA